jgi:hypothetical protein
VRRSCTRIAGDGTYDLVLEARDAGGNLVTTFTGDVVGRIDTGPFIGTDTSVVTAVGGIANFSTQPIELAGTYTLRFTAAGLADAVTPPFDVIAAAAATIVDVEGNDETAPAFTTLPDSLGARVEDAFGNPIAGVTVTWSGHERRRLDRARHERHRRGRRGARPPGRSAARWGPRTRRRMRQASPPASPPPPPLLARTSSGPAP